MSGQKIIDGLQRAVDGDISRVTIQGQLWTKHTLPNMRCEDCDGGVYDPRSRQSSGRSAEGTQCKDGGSMSETPTSISQWTNETFGLASSNARIAARANEEMAELLRAITVDDASREAAEEAADVVIILCRLTSRLGVDLWAEVERKMQINRRRQWNITNDGHGYHVRDRALNPPASP